MRRLIVGTTLAVGPVAATPAVVPAIPPSAAQQTSALACQRAKVGGQTKCIARGQFGTRRHHYEEVR